jgi:hypothetical protein
MSVCNFFLANNRWSRSGAFAHISKFLYMSIVLHFAEQVKLFLINIYNTCRLNLPLCQQHFYRTESAVIGRSSDLLVAMTFFISQADVSHSLGFN